MGKLKDTSFTKGLKKILLRETSINGALVLFLCRPELTIGKVNVNLGSLRMRGPRNLEPDSEI